MSKEVNRKEYLHVSVYICKQMLVCNHTRMRLVAVELYNSTNVGRVGPKYDPSELFDHIHGITISLRRCL